MSKVLICLCIFRLLNCILLNCIKIQILIWCKPGNLVAVMMLHFRPFEHNCLLSCIRQILDKFLRSGCIDSLYLSLYYLLHCFSLHNLCVYIKTQLPVFICTSFMYFIFILITAQLFCIKYSVKFLRKDYLPPCYNF